jgi:hypothetical protein
MVWEVLDVWKMPHMSFGRILTYLAGARNGCP